MPDFSRRDTTPELMDTESVDYVDFRQCLEQLAQANELSLAYRPTLGFFSRLAREGRLPAPRATATPFSPTAVVQICRRCCWVAMASA